MFRGSERIRLITMLGTLCILGMIIFRSINSGAKKPPAAGRELEQTQAEGTERESASAGKAPDIRKLAEKETVTPGPTDEDSEELDAAKDEYQVLTDGTQSIGELEMHAYRRVFDWVEHQSFAAMKKRAKTNIYLDDLLRSPEKFRGELMQIDLNVRQAIPVDGAPLGVKTVYELRGFSEDSGAWLYFVIAPSLPEGMPTGANVEERVRVEGYFFKLHGYLEAGAKPRAAPLRAPLLIGRVKQLASSGEKATPADNNWLYLAAGGFVLLSFIFTFAQFFARQRAKRHQSQLNEYKNERGQTWSGRDNPPRGDTSHLPADSQDDAEDGFDFTK